MSNHLGNVLEVLTDRKLAQDNGVYNPETGIYSSAIPDGLVDYYIADVVSQSDYFPFGSLFANTNFDPSDGSLIEEENDYRYAFNGMEKDDEVTDQSGTSYDFGARFYNPRVGRWLSVDALTSKYPELSPYHYVSNSPLVFKDADGNDFIYTVSYTKDVNGDIIGKEVNVMVNVKIINLTDNTIGYHDYSDLRVKLNSTFDFETTSIAWNQEAGIWNEDVPTKVNFQFTVTEVEDITEVRETDNVLLLVDKLEKGANVNDPGGRAQLNGNVLAVEIQHFANNQSLTAVHELGHIIGLEDEYKTENGEVIEAKDHMLMGAGAKTFYVPKSDLEELSIQHFQSSSTAERVSRTGENIAQRTRDFANDYIFDKGGHEKLQGTAKPYVKPGEGTSNVKEPNVVKSNKQRASDNPLPRKR